MEIHGKWISGIELDDEICLSHDEQAMSLWNHLLIMYVPTIRPPQACAKCQIE